MSKHDKADEARRGLIDSVKGKAKEVVGAVTGNDSLTAEGQLEQTQAHERKEANATEAVAEAQAKQARDDAAEAKADGARQRLAANASAGGYGGFDRSPTSRAEARGRARGAADRRNGTNAG